MAKFRTAGMRELTRRDKRSPKLSDEAKVELALIRPRTRADCLDMPRPCPFVGCRHHLFTEVLANGSIYFPQGSDEEALLTMKQTCALDVASGGPKNAEEVGRLMNVVRERIRQIEFKALESLRLTIGKQLLEDRPGLLPEVEYPVRQDETATWPGALAGVEASED